MTGPEPTTATWHGRRRPDLVSARVAANSATNTSTPSVGQFATDTLIADTKALASGSGSDDSAYEAEQATLQELADDRDRAAAKMKETLADAAAGRMPNQGEIQSGLSYVSELLRRAHQLASQ